MNKFDRKIKRALDCICQYGTHVYPTTGNIHKGEAISLTDSIKAIANLSNRHSVNQVLIFFISFLLIMLLTGCAGGPRDLESRHVDNGGANFGVQLDEMLTFDDYITQTSEAIAQYDGLNKNDNERSLVSPFEKMSDDFDSCNQSSRIGVLLIHGLTDSPFLMRDLSDSLINNQNCILVRAIALPGHATTPGNLLNVEYSQWIQSVEYGIQSFANSSVQNLFIAGFSTGGTLALNHVINETIPTQLDIKGLLLFSPAIRVKQRGGFLANWHKPVSRLSPKRAWFNILDDTDFAKYESFTKNAADQIYLLSKRKLDIKSKHTIPVPMLIVASEEDDTIDTMATMRFFNNRASAKSNFLLYKMALKKKHIQCGLEQRICETGSAYPDLNIESFAHTALLNSPDNFHYGPGKTSYKSCSHYLSNPTHFEDCMSADNERFRWGEISLFDKCDDNCKVVRRLTYNPDFSNMSSMVNLFVSTHKH